MASPYATLKRRTSTGVAAGGAAKKVLVMDKCDKSATKLFADAGIHADEKEGLNEDQLCEIIGEYDALVVRSATTVTPKVVAAAKKMKIIGRAGVGVDNINIPACSNSGIVVVNSPQGNTISAAEHTWAMIMSMARQIPQAHGKLKQGIWARKDFMGIEMDGRSLGIMGFGNIGKKVAKYGQAFGMTVLAYDPFVTAEQGAKLGVTMCTKEEIFAQADVITLHLPSIKETHKLINATTIATMKKGVCIANVARGEVVDEQAIADAVKSGHIMRAALDVFSPEPLSKDSPLLTLDNIIVTPHLGASTKEAQVKVAVDVVEQIITVFGGGAAYAALNIPSMKAHLMEPVRHLLSLADKLGSVAVQLTPAKVKSASLEVSGVADGTDLAPLTTYFYKGLLSKVHTDSVNFVNAPIIAKDFGLEVSSMVKANACHNNCITVKLCLENGGSLEVAGVAYPTGCRLVSVDGQSVETALDGWMMWVQSPDKPGTIGKVGTFLGSHNINVSTFQVSQTTDAMACMVIRTDVEVPDAVVTALVAEVPEVQKAICFYV